MSCNLNTLLKQDIDLTSNLIKIHYNSIRLLSTDTSHILKLFQNGQKLYFYSPDTAFVKEIEEFLTNMLQIHVDRLKLYQNISDLDKHLEKLLKPHLVSKNFESLECTIMKLPPWETLLSFICSSNNNIKRISSMCDKLCEIGGQKLDDIEIPTYGENNEFIDYQRVPIYAFPSCKDLLTKCSENILKEAKFGYRAKYIMQTLQLFDDMRKSNGFEDLSDSQFICLNISPLVKEMTYKQAKEWLVQFSGCGPKVADCVLLYSDVTLINEKEIKQEKIEEVTVETIDVVRNWNGIIPIDAHITRIAIRDFPHIIKKNQKNLELMRESLMKKFGNFGGWIQVLLFTKEIDKSIKN
ncbi:hypothetical protein HANVADRAFT_52178 [Hanseniaspora valbyensis NRRL Y-1626]|uniref:Uncharacterized protein n=1 Tax=Hanseniaspora valbyensis NRRL Y-1626 TaxID=766949 RepID=A0A1B7TGD1_9ASCO|nr:hypothetical protein HANVADRAFT_52178 [Hanseniaspora valbyensis NRRL Y-1626]